MVSGKRKFQENAASTYSFSPGKDAIDRLTELTLHLDLKLHWSKRVGMSKVRLDMIEYKTAEVLLDLLRKVVNGYKTR